jgi:hypothetical protein
MGGAYRIHGRQATWIQCFWFKNLKEIDYLKGLGVYGRMILKWILKKWGGKKWSGFI